MAGSTSKAKKAFVAHYDRLQKAITSPETLAPMLYTNQVIGEHTNSRVISTDGVPSSTKAAWILEGVQEGLQGSSEADAQVLKVFCEVLENSNTPALKRIAASMRSFLDGEVAKSPPPSHS